MDNVLFFQYKVRPNPEHNLYGRVTGAMATVIVFAPSEAVGLARAGRFIARKNWEIEKFLRKMAIYGQHVDNFNSTLKKVYRQSEQYGIAACFDSWGQHPETGVVWRRDDY